MPRANLGSQVLGMRSSSPAKINVTVLSILTQFHDHNYERELYHLLGTYVTEPSNQGDLGVEPQKEDWIRFRKQTYCKPSSTSGKKTQFETATTLLHKHWQDAVFLEQSSFVSAKNLGRIF